MPPWLFETLLGASCPSHQDSVVTKGERIAAEAVGGRWTALDVVMNG